MKITAQEPIAWPESTGLVLGYFSEVVLIGFVATLGGVEVAAYRVLRLVIDLIIMMVIPVRH